MARGKKQGTTNSTSDNNLHIDPATTKKLSHTLGISEDEVKSMLAAKGGDGPPASSRRALQSSQSDAVEAKAPTMSAAWADFMDDDCADVDVDLGSSKKDGPSAPSSNKESASSGSSSKSPTPADPDAPYALPIKTSSEEHKDQAGILAQTGTLDWDIVGRSRKSSTELGPLDICEPTKLTPEAFEGK
ncbi:hypothetical protein TrRE_jg7722, partial [Triparma retinervis]